MPSARVKLLVGVVVILAATQILFEDIIVFLGTTGALPAGMSDAPYLMVAIPLFISTFLVVLLVGAALWDGDAFQ